MIESTTFLVTEDIARRSGTIDFRYRTADNHFILGNKDLQRVRFTTEEYLNGLQGIEQITKERADELIKENNYQMGRKI